jgi:hypothetical protein
MQNITVSPARRTIPYLSGRSALKKVCPKKMKQPPVLTIDPPYTNRWGTRPRAELSAMPGHDKGRRAMPVLC